MNTDQLRLVTELRELADRLSNIKDEDSDLDYEELDNAVEDAEQEITTLEAAQGEKDPEEDEDDAA